MNRKLFIEKQGDYFMQTNLHGRDLIGDLDFSKEEVETFSMWLLI